MLIYNRNLNEGERFFLIYGKRLGESRKGLYLYEQNMNRREYGKEKAMDHTA